MSPALIAKPLEDAREKKMAGRRGQTQGRGLRMARSHRVSASVKPVPDSPKQRDRQALL